MDKRIITFLYLLLRDEVTFGAIEKILTRIETNTAFVLSEPLVESYAKQVFERLKGESSERSVELERIIELEGLLRVILSQDPVAGNDPSQVTIWGQTMESVRQKLSGGL